MLTLEDTLRVMKIMRLRRDLGLNLVGAAMVSELTEENYRLRLHSPLLRKPQQWKGTWRRELVANRIAFALLPLVNVMFNYTFGNYQLLTSTIFYKLCPNLFLMFVIYKSNLLPKPNL